MKKAIAIIDDDSSLVEGLVTLLMTEGYTVFSHADGNGVLEKIKSWQPNLVLLDIWLPGVNGKEIASKLKTDKATNKIPVVLISAHGGLAYATCQTGAEDYLAKPFDTATLLKKIEKFIGKP